MSELMYTKFLIRISRHRIVMHLLFWLGVTGFFFFVFRSQYPPLRTVAINLGFMPGHLIFVYSLLYLLVPRFILKKNIYVSIVIFVGVLLAALMYGRLADTYLVHYSQFNRIWVPGSFPRAIFAFFSVGWIAVSIKLLKYAYVEKENRQQLEREKLKVELQLLKSQLHPHFLFNTLNSLYSLTLERSVQAPEAVLKLSSLLRYMLYECDEPVTKLTKEIDMLETYIALEKSRFGERLDISTSYTGDIGDKLIAPLLLLPFVENAIKHGTGGTGATDESDGQLDKSWISLNLHVGKDVLTFKLVNSAGDGMIHGGIGLQNVRKRLTLLYPGHQLKITAGEEVFMVTLTLRLESAPLHSLRNYFYDTQVFAG
jgi:sensor histidine kinase YesM